MLRSEVIRRRLGGRARVLKGGVQGTPVWEYSNLGWEFCCISFWGGGFKSAFLTVELSNWTILRLVLIPTDIVVYLMIFWTALGKSQVLSKFSSLFTFTYSWIALHHDGIQAFRASKSAILVHGDRVR